MFVDRYLQLAIIQNDTDAAFEMIQCCSNPDFLDIANENQQTALHFSVLMDQVQITRCLVAYGADVECKDRDGKYGLLAAGCYAMLESIVLKLFSEGNLS